MNASDIVIDVHGLTKKFDGRAVVRNLSMQVEARHHLRLSRSQRFR